MEVDFDRITRCSQQFKDIAMNLRTRIYKAEELRSGIVQQSGAEDALHFIAAAVDEMENESFLLLEMSNMLEDISLQYMRTEDDICNGLGGVLFPARKIDFVMVYSGANANNDYKEYFKL